MDLRRALTLFRLSGRVPVDELNASFRILVKKYHPDRLRDHPQWAHERMAEINDAYETLAEWLTEGESAGITEADVDERQEETIRETGLAPSEGETRSLNAAFGRFLDGLALYYQYGLDNPEYRREGPRRFRYREALRLAKKGRDEVAGVRRDRGVGTSVKAVDAASRFSRYSVVSMGSMEHLGHTGLDGRFRRACRSFDAAVKELLFPDLVPRHLKGRSTNHLYGSYAELVLFVSSVRDDTLKEDALLWMNRYDAFMDLLEARRKGHISW